MTTAKIDRRQKLSGKSSLTNVPPDSLFRNNSTTESAKDSPKGRVRIFKVNDKTVAYFIGQEGKMTKDPLTQSEVRLIHNFFARNHVTYTGKIFQSELESITD